MAQRRRLKAKVNTEFSLDEVYQEFKEEKIADGRSDKTITSIDGSYKKFADYTKGKKGKGELVLSDLSRDNIYQYKNHLVKDDGLSLASKNHYLRDLRTFVNWCASRSYIDTVKVDMIKGQESIKQTYSDEQIERLLQKPRKHDSFVEWRSWAIINWILATGNRVNSIVNVTMHDVNFTRKEIIMEQTKNKKVQIIPLSNTLSHVLKEYIKMWRSDANDLDYLFCNNYGEQLTVKALQHSLYSYNKKREVEMTSAHALRHTFARQFIVNGGDTFRLQKILGHSTLDMTRKYVNLFDTDLKNNYEDISPLDRFSKKNGNKPFSPELKKKRT